MTTTQADSTMPPWPRGLSKEEAARYVGVSVRKFDEMVRDRRMPKSKKVDGRRVWDRAKLDVYFTGLPDAEDENVIDRVLSGGRSTPEERGKS